MKKITPKQYATSLYHHLETSAPGDIQAVLAAFVKLVSMNHDLGKMRKIITAFRSYAYEQANMLAVTVTTARTLPATLRADVEHALARSLDKKVVLEEMVDPSLLGGMIVKYGDTVVDGSVRRQLQSLRQALTSTT